MPIELLTALVVGFLFGAATGMTVIVNSRRLEAKALRTFERLDVTQNLRASNALERMLTNDKVVFRDGSENTLNEVFAEVYESYVERMGEKVLDYKTLHPDVDIAYFNELTEIDELKESLLYLLIEWNVITASPGTEEWSEQLKKLTQLFTEDVKAYVDYWRKQ